MRRLLLAPVLAACASCAAAPPVPVAPGPEEVARLQADLARNADDVETLVLLGGAYQATGRASEARPLLERALAADPEHSSAVLFLGLAYEDLELYARARDLYTRYLSLDPPRDLRRALSARLPLLERYEMRAAIRDALAREGSLAGTDTDPSRVAVFPFLFEGGSEEYRPLSLALAELLATDLAQTDRITVLERARMQALLDELQLAASGAVDPATAARGGLLLGAGHIVQGRLAEIDGQLLLQAAVVDVGQADERRSVQDRDALESLFEMEKRVALSIYEALGVELTPAERERVGRRPTENLQALLAFGLGLAAEEQSDFSAAAEHFSRAAALDPDFELATDRGSAAQDLAAGVALSTAELGQLAAEELATLDLPGVGEIQTLVPDVGGRDAAAEVLGTEGVGRSLILEIILRRPR